MTWLDLVLGALCAFRLTQLVVWDSLLEPITNWLANRGRLLDTLLSCAHCSGFWCASVTVLLMVLGHGTSILALVCRYEVWAFALAGVVSIIQHASGWLGEKPPEWVKGTLEAAEPEPETAETIQQKSRHLLLMFWDCFPVGTQLIVWHLVDHETQEFLLRNGIPTEIAAEDLGDKGTVATAQWQQLLVQAWWHMGDGPRRVLWHTFTAETIQFLENHGWKQP